MKSFFNRCRQHLAQPGIIFATIIIFGCSTHYSPAKYKSPDTATFRTERVILNLTEAPQNSMALTWRTDTVSLKPQAKITPAAILTNENASFRTIQAKTDKVILKNGSATYHHNLIFNDLKPSTLYAYCIGDGQRFSEWNHFKTANEKSSPFSFLYFGDMQNQIQYMGARVLREAYKKAPDADFWLFTGDIVNNGDNDSEWGEFFEAAGWIPETTPFIMTPGNHEYPNKLFVRKSKFSISDLWHHNFTLPENGPAGLEETTYYIDYQGVRFVMLNSNEKLPEQVKWLEKVLSGSTQKWIIVAIHQPIYSTGRSITPTDYRKVFVPVFDKYNIDLVLQAHNHSYSRTYPLKNGKQCKNNKKGTVYTISATGPKTYPANDRHKGIMEVADISRQLFQVISIKKNKLLYKSFDATGRPFDSFDITK